MKEAGIYFVMDVHFVKEGEKDEHSQVMEQYADYPKEMIAAFEENKTFVSEGFYTDSYGTFFSGFAPFYDGGELLCVVGIDIAVQDFSGNYTKLFKYILLSNLDCVNLGNRCVVCCDDSLFAMSGEVTSNLLRF